METPYECCGETRICVSSEFNGYYCKDCYKLLLSSAKEGIKQISDIEQDNRRRKKYERN